MALDSIIWFVLAIVIGGSVCVGVAKLFSSHLKSQDKKMVFEVIEGKTPNNLKLDGKIIDVNRFTYKDDDGELKKKVKLADIVKKTPPRPLNEPEIPFFNRLLIKYWKRREIKKKKRK